MAEFLFARPTCPRFYVRNGRERSADELQQVEGHGVVLIALVCEWLEWDVVLLSDDRDM